jgi:RNA polymerase sigma-70 factor (ECF subfamily)
MAVRCIATDPQGSLRRHIGIGKRPNADAPSSCDTAIHCRPLGILPPFELTYVTNFDRLETAVTVLRPARVSCSVREPLDGEIVRRVLAGDVEAYAILVRRHRDRLYRFAAGMLGNRHDAEEAVQDALVRAFRALARCDQPDRFEGWLFRILANRCRTRGAQRRRYGMTFVGETPALARAAAPGTGPDEVHEWSTAVAEALAALPIEQREAFLLKYVEERSYDEMAELTGAGVSALKMRVKRAVTQLRDLLADSEEAYA